MWYLYFEELLNYYATTNDIAHIQIHTPKDNISLDFFGWMVHVNPEQIIYDNVRSIPWNSGLRLCSIALTNPSRCPSLFCKMVYTLNPGKLRRERVPGSTLVAQARLESVFRVDGDQLWRARSLPERWICLRVSFSLLHMSRKTATRSNTLKSQHAFATRAQRT